MTETPEDKAIKGRPVAKRIAADLKVSAPDDLDAAYSEVRRPPYLFTWAAREWTLCHFAELDYETQAAIEGSADMDLAALNDLFRQAMGDVQAADWARVTRPVGFLSMLFERWLKHSGAKPGEDSASSGSSGSTGKSSRRTSGGSMASGSPKRSTAAKKAPARARREPSARAVAGSLRESS